MDIYELARQGKIKRYFRARNKISGPEVISHVTQRASGKEWLFIEESDYLTMLRLLKETCEKFNISFFSFALMPTHLHLLFQQKEDNLPSAMKNIFWHYSRYFNHKYEREGNLYSSSYRQAVCFDEVYLLVSSLYIHLNPVRANLVKEYTEYKWTSWKLYTEDLKRKTFIKFKPILYFLDQNLNVSREKYRKLLMESNKVRKGEVLKDKNAIENFKNLVLDKIFEIRSKYGKNIFSNNTGYIDDFKLQKDIENLKKKNTFSKPSTQRAIKFTIEQLISRGFNKTEIAKKLNINRKTLYKYLA